MRQVWRFLLPSQLSIQKRGINSVISSMSLVGRLNRSDQDRFIDAGVGSGRSRLDHSLPRSGFVGAGAPDILGDLMDRSKLLSEKEPRGEKNTN
jgi:hypothetical protein